MNKAEIKELIKQKEKEYNLPDGLLNAVVKIESNYDVEALGRDQEIGLAQILPKGGAIGDWEAFHGHGPWDYWNPGMNLTVAAWYLGERIPFFLKKYGHVDSIENRIWCYNAGIGNMNKGVLPQITKNYISKVHAELGDTTNRKGLSASLLLAAALLASTN